MSSSSGITTTRRRPRFRAIGVSLLLSLVACDAGPPYTVRKLPSGREVKVVAVSKMSFTRGDPALMLKYQTDLRIEDKEALRKEVEDIWQVFRLDVEEAGLKNAIVSANEVPKGWFIKKGRGYNFIVIKNEAGVWQFQN